MKIPLQILMGLVLCAVCAMGSGCALVRKGAARVVSPMANQLSEGLMYQSDVQLVRDGSPAFLLILDALVEAHPDNPELLRAAAEAQLAYATVFIDKDQSERSKAMLFKAKTYGQRALSQRNSRFAKAMDGQIDDFTRSLRSFRKRDAETLLTTATAWVMWIIASSDSPAALGDMPKVLALMDRIRELDPDIRQGGVEVFQGIYFTVLPLGGGRDLERARTHFERSIHVAGPDYLLNRVTFAEFYARYAFDRDLFERTLTEVLEATPETPEYTLMNTVAKIRAQELLNQMDDWF